MIYTKYIKGVIRLYIQSSQYISSIPFFCYVFGLAYDSHEKKYKSNVPILICRLRRVLIFVLAKSRNEIFGRTGKHKKEKNVHTADG